MGDDGGQRRTAGISLSQPGISLHSHPVLEMHASHSPRTALDRVGYTGAAALALL